MRCIVCTSIINNNESICEECHNLFEDYAKETNTTIVAESIKESIRLMVGSALREARNAARTAGDPGEFMLVLQERSLRR